MVHALDWRLESNGAYWRLAYRDAKGIIRRVSLGPKSKISKAEANRRCRRIIAKTHANPGATANQQRVRLKGWIDEYLDGANMADSTVAVYEATRVYLVEFFGAEGIIRQIDRNDAARFAAWLRTQTYTRGKRTGIPLTEQTVRKHIRNAKSLFHAAHDRDLIPINPFDREASSVLEVDQDWRYVSLEEFERMIDATPSHDRRALLALLRLAGLRRGEALRLRWSDLDWNTRRLTVTNTEGVRTTKKRARVVPMTPRLHEILLAAFEAAEDGADLVAPVNDGNLIRTVEGIIRRAGLTPWPKPLHTLRKNCETDWLAEYPIMDVCKWLGHAPGVAFKHYHQTREETMQKAAGIEPVSPKSPQKHPAD